MRLLGFLFSGVEGPVREAYVPLGELTALFGAKDVGKSRLAKSFARALTEPDDAAAVFCLARLEGDTLHNLLFRVDREAGHQKVLQQNRARELGWSPALAGPQVSERRGLPLQELITLCVEDQAERCGFGAVKEIIRSSPFFAFRPERVAGFLPTPLCCAVFACLPPRDGLDPSSQMVAERFLAEATELQVSQHFMQRSDLPVPLYRIGNLPLDALPLPLLVPMPEDRLLSIAAKAISRLVSILEWHDDHKDLIQEFAQGCDDSHLTSAAFRSMDAALHRVEETELSAAAWIESPDPATWRVKPDAALACEVMDHWARSLSPALISDRYTVSISASPVSAFDTSHPLTIGMALRDTVQNGVSQQPGSVFGIDDVAEGLRVWLQLCSKRVPVSRASLTSLSRTLWPSLSRLMTSGCRHRMNLTIGNPCRILRTSYSTS